MATVQAKLPDTICDPCPVPAPKLDETMLKPTARTLTVIVDHFGQMLHNMTAIKACAVWPSADETE